MTNDLTSGSVTKHILYFTIPLIFGNLFQLTYNAVDSIVIGQFAGDNALAAVGTADPVMNLLILGITGLCIGASVLMSNYFGAGDKDNLKKEFATILTLGGCIAGVILIIGLLLSKYILILLQVPDEILNDANLYLRVIFIGMPFVCIYNIFAAALRSVGDSKTPIKYLAYSSIINMFFDVVFVKFCNMGVFGAGLSTVIAQSVSAIACIIYVYRKIPILHISKSDFKYNKNLFSKTLQYGTTTALQQCSQPVGKLFIQGMVNTLGISTIAAFNAVGKIEDFALVPERSIANSMMTFVAQNDGAKKGDRVRKGLLRGMTLEFSYFIFICIVVYLFNKPMLSLFSTDSVTLQKGSAYFSVMAFFYFLPAFTNGMQGFFRGIKHMEITLAGTIVQIAFRVIFTYILISKYDITGIAYACAIGWIAMLILDFSYYFIKVKKTL